MSAQKYGQLLQQAFNGQEVFEKPATEVYADMEKAEAAVKQQKKAPDALHDNLAFRFERVRLGVALALIKAFTRLSDNPDSHQVLDLLQKAIKASSPSEIDAVVQGQMDVFENLYMEMFANPQRDQVLELFEQVLQAASVRELNQIIGKSLQLLDELEYPEEETE